MAIRTGRITSNTIPMRRCGFVIFDFWSAAGFWPGLRRTWSAWWLVATLPANQFRLCAWPGRTRADCADADAGVARRTFRRSAQPQAHCGSDDAGDGGCRRHAPAVSSTSGALALIYAALLVMGICRAFIFPAVASLMPHTVPESEYANAAAWEMSLSQIATISGPAIGGIGVAVFGDEAIIECLLPRSCCWWRLVASP